MPSIYTHTVFAYDVKNKLNKNTQILIEQNKRLYELFSQSFDNLYYYNFLSLKKGKHIRNLAYYAHTHKTQKYIINIINFIKDNNLKNNSDIMCYLYGTINHYISDSTLHPYITYKTGRFSSERKKDTKKYLGIHTNTEIALDSFYYHKITKKEFKNYKIYKDLCKKVTFSKNLKNTINYAFKETFNINSMGDIFNTSYNQSYYVYRILMYDPFGIKLFAYKIIDFLLPNSTMKLASYSLHKEPVSNSFFNKKHHYWCNPTDMNIISYESWEDVYKKAINKAVILINNINLYFENKITEKKLLKLIGNNCYSSGLDCSKKRIMQYFEF
ncbi:MAG: zinc dependent phospholipase C family protein [Bacilli bacterium]|nr:zinc dependent phospholipase C family protein [Bacilli bacterium]